MDKDIQTKIKRRENTRDMCNESEIFISRLVLTKTGTLSSLKTVRHANEQLSFFNHISLLYLK